MAQLFPAASALSADGPDLGMQALLIGEHTASQGGTGVTRRVKPFRFGAGGSEAPYTRLAI